MSKGLECGCHLADPYYGIVDMVWCPMHRAAPELLEALKGLFMGAHLRDCRAEVSKDGMCVRGCAAARAAIAKAEGSAR